MHIHVLSRQPTRDKLRVTPMKPHVIMHMQSGIDGRIVTAHWPENSGEVYERVHGELEGDAWIVGSVTMAEFAKGEPRPVTTDETFPRKTWKAPGAEKGPYGIAVDRRGKLHLNTARINGDALIAVLTTTVSDNHLAELRRDGISYIFAGDTDVDLALALRILESEFAVERLLLEGGGGINGAFLTAGLIDEISLLVMPFADGAEHAPTLFDRPAGAAAALKLQSVSRLEGDVLHLRYSVT
jgi:riboflavin biosynthesis pyrimidine reductase